MSCINQKSPEEEVESKILYTKNKKSQKNQKIEIYSHIKLKKNLKNRKSQKQNKIKYGNLCHCELNEALH